jgi:hypothetical protein
MTTFSERLIERYAPVSAATQGPRYLPFLLPEFKDLPPSMQKARVELLREYDIQERKARGEWTWYR